MATHGTLTIDIIEGLMVLFILWKIISARMGKELFIRKINGLNAIDESVGRATEMGKPLLFSSGMSGFGIVGLQAMAILSYVANKSALYQSDLISAYSDSLLFAAGDEVTREAYENQGASDLYDPGNSRFLSENQFAYTSSVVGIMHRENPASIIYMGFFAGEALILTENGQQTGALQIAGTPETVQVPFFLASCDYTIIGDEYYAAAAYLSKEPTMLGSLVGQDYCKILIIIFIIVGFIINILNSFLSLSLLETISKFFS